MSFLPADPLEQERLVRIVVLTLYMATMSTVISSAVGIPIGAYLGMRKTRFSLMFRVFTHTLYGMPPVIAGLVMYLMLSRAGPLGEWGLLFTPTAMILAQCLLITPLVIGLSASAVDALPKGVTDTARTLGADRRQLIRTVLYESRLGLFTAVMVGFGRAISEVGAVIIVGGNIKWHTQVLTTAIVLETGKGNFSYALVLGGILITIALVTATVLTLLQHKQRTGRLFGRTRRTGGAPP